LEPDFRRELKIDLRSLPYHSLYGIKKSLLNNTPIDPPKFESPEFNDFRLLGRPRVGKHEVKADSCTLEGEYKTQIFTKRNQPDIFKRLKK
jgi:hypothetical protein